MSGFYLGYPNRLDRNLLSTLLESLPDFFRREWSVDVPDPQFHHGVDYGYRRRQRW